MEGITTVYPEGGYITTIRYSKDTGDHCFALNVTVLIPLGDMKTKKQVEDKIVEFGKEHKKEFVDMFLKKEELEGGL